MPIDFTARARTLARSAPGYPRSLLDLKDPPEEVRVVGTLPRSRPAVSIVGTRRADEEALEFTYDLSRALALDGWVVVSGGALGIDGAAHEGALDAGGLTVVVLPIGFDSPYPEAHRGLFERAAESGALLTEVPDGADLQRGRFLTRNRLVAALGRATVVIQAPARSGALSTARHAKALGRRVYVTPSSPWDPRGLGNLGLLRRGATICTGPRDVLSESPHGVGAIGSPKPPRTDEDQHDYNSLSQSELQILDALEGRPRHAEDLCGATGIPAFEVQRSILSLLVRGLVEERPGGRFKSCRPREKSY